MNLGHVRVRLQTAYSPEPAQYFRVAGNLRDRVLHIVCDPVVVAALHLFLRIEIVPEMCLNELKTAKNNRTELNGSKRYHTLKSSVY